MAYYGGLEGILTGLTKSTDHPSTENQGDMCHRLDKKLRIAILNDSNEAARPELLLATSDSSVVAFCG